MSDPKYENIGAVEDRLVEECGELIQAISKANRFGWESYNPALREISSKTVWNEMDDVMKRIIEMRHWISTTTPAERSAYSERRAKAQGRAP